MKSIPKPAVEYLKFLLYKYEKPPSMIGLLLLDIKNGFKFQKTLSQRNFLIECEKNKVCPIEIKKITASINSDKHRNENKEQEQNIIKIRIRKSIIEIKKKQQNCDISSLNITKENLPEEILKTHRSIKETEIARCCEILEEKR